MSNILYTKTVITKYCQQDSISKSFFHLHISVNYGILKKQMLTILEKPINGFQWEKSFQNMNVNEMVHLFKRTIKNILHNFIPHETIACDDRDPPSINSSIRRLIQDKSEACKRFKRSNNNSQYYENFQSLQNLLGNSIEASKERHYSRLSKKLMEPCASPKTFWSALKSFHNNKKIPCILPIFLENRFVTNFTAKAELFKVLCYLQFLKNTKFVRILLTHF